MMFAKIYQLFSSSFAAYNLQKYTPTISLLGLRCNIPRLVSTTNKYGLGNINKITTMQFFSLSVVTRNAHHNHNYFGYICLILPENSMKMHYMICWNNQNNTTPPAELQNCIVFENKKIYLYANRANSLLHQQQPHGSH